MKRRIYDTETTLEQVNFLRVCRELAILSKAAVWTISGDEYLYIPANNLITIPSINSQPTKVEQNMDALFLENLMTLSNQSKKIESTPMPILSFLHELGHCHTFTPELAFVYIMEEKNVKEMVGKGCTCEELQKYHFQTEPEVVANKWLVSFVEEYFDKIMELWKGM